MDTANDPRFAVLERALLDLKGIFERGHLKAQFDRDEAAKAAERAHGALMGLKYANADPETLRGMEPFGRIETAADAIEELLGGPDFADRIADDAVWVARTRWALDQVRSFGERLDLPGAGWETAVEAVAGRVVSASAHPEADGLQVTRVAAGRSLRVVTNDASVDADDAVGVALLPPVELGGVVSEGMFLGVKGEGVLRDVEAGEDGRPDVPDEAWTETRGLLAAYAEAD